MIRVPPTEGWQSWFRELAAAGRAGTMQRAGADFWVATERRGLVGDGDGWERMECLGPTTASALAARLALPADDVQVALHALEAEGQAFQGYYLARDGEKEWCNRRILARIHRLTLGKLRREIEPVTAAQFHQFLFRWQHAAPGTELHGSDGLLQIIKQLAGCEIAAPAWESDIFLRRIVDYKPEYLDDLCLSGEVAWARLSAHPGLSEEGRKVRPTRIAPIAFFPREYGDWLARETPISITWRICLTRAAKCWAHCASAGLHSSPTW